MDVPDILFTIFTFISLEDQIQVQEVCTYWNHTSKYRLRAIYTLNHIPMYNTKEYLKTLHSCQLLLEHIGERSQEVISHMVSLRFPLEVNIVRRAIVWHKRQWILTNVLIVERRMAKRWCSMINSSYGHLMYHGIDFFVDPLIIQQIRVFGYS